MTTTMPKTAKKQSCKKNSFLPPSADVVKISGHEYLIVPLDDFREWDEDRMLAALMAKRLESDEELIPIEEVEKRLDAKKKKRP